MKIHPPDSIAPTLSMVTAVFLQITTQAAITLVDTDFAHTGSNSSPNDFTLTTQGSGSRDGVYSFNYNAGASFDMLVVTVSRESSGSTENDADFPPLGGRMTVSYDGAEMNLAAGDTTSSGVTIYYLATTTQSGTIALDYTEFRAVNGIGIGIAAISSADGPIGLNDAISGSGTSITVDTADDSFTMWAIDTNGNAFNNLPTNQIVKVTDIGSNGYAVAYEAVTTGQTGDTYSYTNPNSPRGIAAANFVVVPEPSVAIISTLGTVLLLRRKRN